MRPLLRQVPKLQRLAIFDAVARLGSFTAAGVELGISQPAVSRQIAQLEDHLHLVLFDRSGGRPNLTSDGERFHHSIHDSFTDIELTLAQLRTGLDVLTIAVQPAVAENWFAPNMAALQEAMAPATLQVVLFEHGPELRSIAHDVSIRFGDGDIAHMRSMKLVEEVAVPAAAPGYAAQFGLDADSTGASLLGCELLQFDQTGRSWADWTEYFASLDVTIDRPPPQIVYRAHASVVAQALAGRGLVLTWRKMRDDLFTQSLLVECGPTLVVPGMGHHLVWPAALSRDPGFRRLRSFLTELVGSD